MTKIVTDNIYPPIGRCDHDWSAHWDGYEPGDPIGYGRTEQEAIDDLVENYEEPRTGGAPLEFSTLLDRIEGLDPDRLREDRLQDKLDHAEYLEDR